jgi:chemotaxis protein methyltransferase CheR
MNNTNENIDIEDIEVQLFIDSLFMKYGYDFRNYSRAHMKRRIQNRMRLSDFPSISHMQHKVLRDEDFFNKILPDFSINVTEMFRDPDFFANIRENIIPLLKTC